MSPVLLLSALILLPACAQAGPAGPAPPPGSTPAASIAAAQAASDAGAPARIRRHAALMGTHVRIVVETGARAASVALSEDILRSLEAAEDRLTTWRPDGELARVQTGEIEASARLRAELDAALTWSDATGGAFDPRIGALSRAWGLRSGGRIPSAAERRAAAADRSLWDEGGFGKGAALAEIQGLLAGRDFHRVVVDLGGQLLCAGAGPFEVGLAHPRERARPLGRFAIPGGSVATSGNGERTLSVDGRRVGHLLDPRTGAPAADFGSLTVWSRDPLAADCLATGLAVLGPEAALAWADARPEVAILVAEPGDDGVRLRASAGFPPLVPEPSE